MKKQVKCKCEPKKAAKAVAKKVKTVEKKVKKTTFWKKVKKFFGLG